MKRLELALRLAKEAGQLAQGLRAARGDDFVSAKGDRDFVTKADKQIEAFLTGEIAAAFPEDGVLGEERGQTLSGEYLWVIDPVDGTANYLRGLPEWGVSIACVRGDQIVLGVIGLPDLGHQCWAQPGHGAFMDGAQLTANRTQPELCGLAILGTSSRGALGEHLEDIQALIEHGFDYRRQGAASYGLVCVAAGWADFYYEAHLYPWDALAGLLLVREADGVTSPFNMSTFLRDGGEVFAARHSAISEIKAVSVFLERRLGQTDRHVEAAPG